MTNDSLGLHLAIALKKKVVAIFGSTPHHEIHLFGLGEKLVPNVECDILPCINKTCDKGKKCIDNIKPETVFTSINKVLSKSGLNNEANKNS